MRWQLHCSPERLYTFRASRTTTFRCRARFINRGQYGFSLMRSRDAVVSSRCVRAASIGARLAMFRVRSVRALRASSLVASCSLGSLRTMIGTKTLDVCACRTLTRAKCRRFVRARARCRKNVVLTRRNETPCIDARVVCVECGKKVAQNRDDDVSLIFFLQ